MSYLVLARKCRPQTFEEVVGQPHIITTLKNAVQSDRVAHALIFAGPRGVGKTSVARILAKALNCEKGPAPIPCNACEACREITEGITVDVFEIDGASSRGIEEIRELRENVKYMPMRGRHKIYIIDEVHMLTEPAFNALLKTLEEPPAHVIFIFATTELHKIPATIQSRCQVYNFKRIIMGDLVAQIKKISETIGIQLSENLLWMIAREAEGGMRDALSLLDQVAAYADGPVVEENALDLLGIVDRKKIAGMAYALLSKNALQAIELLDELYFQGYDVKRVYALIIEHLRNILVIKMSKEPGRLVELSPDELETTMQEIRDYTFETINCLFQILIREQQNVKFASQPKLAAEIAFILAAQYTQVTPIETIIQRLDDLQRMGGLSRSASPPVEVPKPPVGAPLAVATVSTTMPDAQKVSISESIPVEGVTEDNIRSIWGALLDVFEKEHPSIAPSLEHCTLIGIKGEILTISVRGNGFHIKRIQEKKELIESVCSAFLKQKIRVELVPHVADVSNQNDQAASPPLAEKNRNAQKEALNNPALMDTIEVLGGRVVGVNSITKG
ncbi:MAG: DNA polymerase III subunit gamma/tau [Pseudomonadota bacterium]